MTHLANLRDDVDAFRHLQVAVAARFNATFYDAIVEVGEFRMRYITDLANAQATIQTHLSKRSDQRDEQPAEDDVEKVIWSKLILPLRNGIRSLWACQNPQTRFWLFSALASTLIAYRKEIPLGTNITFLEESYTPGDLPPLGPLQQALSYLYKSERRALVCENPDCVSKYFFGVRKGQKFCSYECGGDSRKRSKRKYWHSMKRRERRAKRRKER